MLLNVADVHKAYGTNIILRGASFRLEMRTKAALIGRNGTGKTTLLKLITGQEKPDSGSISLARGAKVGYLRQKNPVDLNQSVLQNASAARAELLKTQLRLQELEEILKGTPSNEDLEEYAILHEHFLENEGYSAERDIRTVLQRMGFEEEDFDRSAKTLSGGERTRLALAQMLLEEPDLLILDEPTNHLDLQATEWLEGWINSYHGAVLLVSHDRTFLENTSQVVFDLRNGAIKSYPGSFNAYLKLKAEEDARQTEVAKQQDRKIAKLDEYVRRFMNSQRTAQARGRLKMLDKVVANKVNAPSKSAQMAGTFGNTKRSGDLVIEAKKLSVGFKDATLIKDFDWVVQLGDRWGVVGENGAGKSTLIKTLLDRQEALSGASRIGANVVVGYFSQDSADLDPESSPLDLLVWEADMLPADARNLLAKFLITGDDVYRPIKTLSGGEQNKVTLALLTRLNPNLLVLDEPTNHLDMDSRQALAEILKDYQGTLVLVSHDRWLLDQLTEQTLDIRRSGPITYPGSYGEYRNRNAVKAKPTAKTAVAHVEAAPALSHREIGKEISRLERLHEEIEKNVEGLELELKYIESQLANPQGEDVVALSKNHANKQAEITEAMINWEETGLQLEHLRTNRRRNG